MSDFVRNINWNSPPQLQEKEFFVVMSYDALNRPVTVTQPDNTVVTDIYDKGGLLKQVLHNSAQHITNITYNPRGQRENIYYGNNTKTKYEYNFSAINAMQNYTQHYQYDALGNMLQMQSQNRWTRDYIYATATNRLLKHDAQQTFDDYTYDGHGNMLRICQ